MKRFYKTLGALLIVGVLAGCGGTKEEKREDKIQESIAKTGDIITSEWSEVKEYREGVYYVIDGTIEGSSAVYLGDGVRVTVYGVEWVHEDKNVTMEELEELIDIGHSGLIDKQFVRVIEYDGDGEVVEDVLY